MIDRERLEQIRDFDTCVTLKESEEMARRLLGLTPVYQERRVYFAGKKHVEYWADISLGIFSQVAESERRVLYTYLLENHCEKDKDE